MSDSNASMIQELTKTMRDYEHICARIIAKSKWSIRDEIDYNITLIGITQCEDKLAELGVTCE